jgi:hypothetical protein
MDPLVQWDNGELNQGHRIRLIQPINLTRAAIVEKFNKIRKKLGL